MLKKALWFLLILPLSGCWSSKEINYQSLYVGMALDEERTNKSDTLDGNNPIRETISSTIQIVSMQTSSTSVPKNLGGGQNKPYQDLTISGESILEIIREASLQLDRPIIGHHLKAIVIGKELAGKAGIDQLLDFYLRDNDIRTSSLVFVSSGRASEVMQSDASGDIPSMHLSGLVDNRFRNVKILPAQTLAKMNGYFQEGGNFVLQNVVAANGEMKLSGAGVFDGQTRTLKGFLNEDDVESLIWLNGLGKGGVLKTRNPRGGNVMTYEIKSMKSKNKTTLASDGRVVFDVRIQSRGRWIEDWKDPSHPHGGKSRKEAEEIFADAVEDGIERLLDKLQNSFKIDGAEFGERLRIQHPAAWRRLKPDWNSEFSRAVIHVNVQTKIEDYGTKNASMK